MSKRINKKTLSLLLVVATLMQFGSAAPSQQPTGTKITDLPYDCLHEIFKFCATITIGSEAELYDIKSLLTLRLVCKKFKQAVKLVSWSLSFRFSFKEQQQKMIGILGDVFDNVKRLELNSCNFEKTNIAWPINLQTLLIDDCKNFNYTSIPKSTKLHTLVIENCANFDETGLKKLTNLHRLRIAGCDGFVGTELKKLINLHTIIIEYCDDFVGIGLKELTNLNELCCKGCNQFDKNSDAVKTLKKNGCTVTVNND